MKLPAGSDEQIRQMIIDSTGVDPGKFHIGGYTPGTRSDVTHAEVIAEIAKSMVRIRNGDYEVVNLDKDLETFDLPALQEKKTEV